ncbi:MAG: hypothetical protein VX278_09330, partial [Myxococcota bacterium]|nr:hypothetical protein [Myxococcota bacterium]
MYRAFMVTFSLFTVACTAEPPKVQQVNPPPEVLIQTPVDEAELYQGNTYLIQGLASDEFYASDLSSLRVIITLNGQTICPDTTVADSGEILCEHIFEQPESVVLVMQVTNSDDLAASDSVSFEVLPNAAPDVSILNPLFNGYYYSDYEILFEGLVSDLEDDSTSLSVDWTSSLDGVLHTQNASADGVVEYSTQLSQGTHTITLDVTDTRGRTNTDSVDIEVMGENQTPSCEIVEPLADLMFPQGEEITFSGLVFDPDIPEELLTVVWTSSIDGELFSGSPDSDGTTAFSSGDLQSGTHSVSLSVEDEKGLSCTSSMAMIVNANPIVEILSPLDGDVFNENEAVLFEGLVSDSDEGAEELAIQWQSSVDGVFSITPALSNGDTNAMAYGLFLGNHTITLSATDATGEMGSASIDIRINDLPSAPTISIDPVSPQSD